LARYFCDFAKIRPENLSIRIFYKNHYKDIESKWKECNFQAEQQHSVSDIMKSPNSFVSALLRETTENFAYHNDKKVAIKNKEYILNPKDKKPYGSIFGFKFNIEISDIQNYLEVMVFFSTFKEKLCKSNRTINTYKVRHNLRVVYVPRFKIQLKEKLIQLLSDY